MAATREVASGMDCPGISSRPEWASALGAMQDILGPELDPYSRRSPLGPYFTALTAAEPETILEAIRDAVSDLPDRD